MRAATPTAPRQLQPLTERILARFPGRREVWTALWALVPWANAGANVLLDTEGAVWDQSRTLVILNYAALSFAIVITLWGSERIPRRLETLPAATATVLAGNETDRFREMNSIVGPLLAAAVTALVFGVEAFVRDGWTSGLLRGVTWFVLGVAVGTFLWTYGALQLGLDRLGRERLDPNRRESIRAWGCARSAISRSSASGCCSRRWFPFS